MLHLAVSYLPGIVEQPLRCFAMVHYRFAALNKTDVVRKKRTVAKSARPTNTCTPHQAGTQNRAFFCLRARGHSTLADSSAVFSLYPGDVVDG